MMEAFRKYPWPGNIRELDHVIESAMCMAGDESLIAFDHLPPHLKTGLKTDFVIPSHKNPAAPSPVAEEIAGTLEEVKNNRS
ncbi:MAG: hypothetical protein AB1497_12110 [Bacillota bacterium]